MCGILFLWNPLGKMSPHLFLVLLEIVMLVIAYFTLNTLFYVLIFYEQTDYWGVE